MAEKSLIGKPKELIEATPEEMAKLEKVAAKEITEAPEKSIIRQRYSSREEMEKERQKQALESWVPKTELGRLVKTKKITNIDVVLAQHKTIVEPEIVDTLLKLDQDLLLVGQAKGKFGGGKRRAWRQTQKKTMESNVTSFSCMAVVGDRNGHVGIGIGKAKETLPSRVKALRAAKLNIMKVIRGFETKEEPGAKPHTVPFVIEGKCGSVRLKLIPAPRGTGLVIGEECKRILRLAGIEDVYSKTDGQTRTVFNFANACIDALKKIEEMKQ